MLTLRPVGRRGDGRLIDEFCPECGTKRVALFRFCRVCGLDFDELDASGALPLGPYALGRSGEATDVDGGPPRGLRATVDDRRPRSLRGLIASAMVLVAIALIGGVVLGGGVLGGRKPSGQGAVAGVQATPVATPGASAAPSGSDVSTGPGTSGSLDAGASPTLPDTGSTPPGPPLEAYTSVDPVQVDSIVRADFEGHMAIYRWRSVSFSKSSTAMRWDAWTATRIACEVDWSIEPAGSDPVAGTLAVKGESHVTGDSIIATPFVSSQIVVTSTCPNWIISLKGVAP